MRGRARITSWRMLYKISVPLHQNLPQAQTSCGKSFGWRFLLGNFSWCCVLSAPSLLWCRFDLFMYLRLFFFFLTEVKYV